jgi:acyl dehydratase
MKVGDVAEITRRFSEADVAAYVALGGAPTHDGALPEPLLGALFTYLLGVELPGPGANYLKQHTRYLKPAAIGKDIRAQVTVTIMRPDKRLVDLSTVCFDADGALLCEGRALLLYAA